MGSSVLLFAAEAEEAANPILPTLNEMFYGAIAFGLLFVLVKFVLLPPVQATREARASQIRGDLDAAERARSQAGSAATEVDDQLAGVKAEAAAVVDAARAEAEAERATIIGAAEAEAASIRSAAEAEIETARAEAMSGATASVAELAADAASRVMNRPIDLASAQPVVDRYLSNPN